MTEIATVYAIFANGEEAERIGKAMIEDGLAACINILAPCRSIYRWKDATESAEEVPALFKTRVDTVDALIAAVAKMHSYEIPAIVAWPIVQAGPGYAEWVASGQLLGLR